MGLSVSAKHLAYDDSYDCGYITFAQFRFQLAKTYNKEFGELYEKWAHGAISQAELDRMNKLSNNDLNVFLIHSDCDGKFTPQECKRIYNAIKNFEMDMQGHNYGTMKTYNMLEQWKKMFQHCYKNRVTLYFG